MKFSKIISARFSNDSGVEKEIKYLEIQLKSIRFDAPYETNPSVNIDIYKEYYIFLNSYKSPYNLVYSSSVSEKYRKDNGDVAYINWLRETRDYLLCLLSPISGFDLVRKKVREEKINKLLVD